MAPSRGRKVKSQANKVTSLDRLSSETRPTADGTTWQLRLQILVLSVKNYTNSLQKIHIHVFSL